MTIVLSLFIVSFGYFYYNAWEVSRNDYLNQVENIIDNNDESNLENALINMTYKNNLEVLVENMENNHLITTSTDYEILNFENIINNNGFYNRFPELSLIKYGLLPQRETYNNKYNIIVFYDITNYIENILVFSMFMVVSYLVGIVLIWVIGSSKIKNILLPITQITDSAKKISGENLDMRIDVGEAKYELKDLALTINAMIDRIEDSYVKQQRFVSDVSHELRTPISVINGYANMLDRWGKDNPDVLQESIDALKNEAGNMGDLVEKLLFLARHDRDTLKYEMSNFNLSEMMEDITKQTEMIDNNHNITSEINDEILLYGDPYRIKQVIRIFIDNAIKYTPVGGDICIRGYKDRNYAMIEVQDWGIGIGKNDLNNIFDRFFRADESRTKDTGGYGLGLSIAKIIVLQHGGKIKVRSKLGFGTIFIIQLPVANKKILT